MSFSRGWSHKSRSKEVSLAKEEGLAAREESTDEGESGEEVEEETSRQEAPVPKKKGWVGASRSLTRPSTGPILEVLNIIENKLVRFLVAYWISKDFFLHALRPEDQVTSISAGCLAMYEENLHAGLHFPLHPFFCNVLYWYVIVPT